jgi:hypothetical protein
MQSRNQVLEAAKIAESMNRQTGLWHQYVLSVVEDK